MSDLAHLPHHKDHVPVPPTAEAAERDPRASTTLIVTLVGTILLLAVVLAAQLLYQRAEWIGETATDAPRNPALVQLQTEQLATISQYRMIDPQHGIAAVPIDQGIRLFLSDLKTGSAPPRILTTAPAAATQAAPAETQPGNQP
ncbi:MAG: hypothetical protein AB1716_08315 [Planctomycetota bacterium]